MDTNKNTVSFLSKEEQKRFDSDFFSRKIRDEISLEEKTLDNFFKKEKPTDKDIKIDLYKYFIQETNDSYCGIWIDGTNEDGISWLSEKILRMFLCEQISIATPKPYILKGNKEMISENLPEISDLIGKKQFIKCAAKSGLMEKLHLFILICTILIPIVLTLFGNAVQIINVPQYLSILVIIAILVFFVKMFSSLKNTNEKRIEDFLNIIHNNEKLEKSKDKYEILVKLLAEKISNLDSPRILVVDDFSSLNKLSQDVLKKYYETKKEYQINKELWIVINTNTAFSEQSKSWENKDNKSIPKFQYARLVTLKSKEKKDLVKAHGLPSENSSCEVIKDICSKDLSCDSFKKIQDTLKNFQRENEDTFRFLYLIASNAVPADIECTHKALIENIQFTKKSREQDKYISTIFKNLQVAPDVKQLEWYFGKIEEFLSYPDNKKRFRVKNNIVRYIKKEDSPLYRNCNGYWAICWYSFFEKKQWKVSWIAKLAHHLKKAYIIENDNSLKKKMFDAYMLVIEKSVKYFLQKEMINMIEDVLKRNIQYQDNSKEQFQQLTKYIVFAFLNFDYLPDRRKMEEIGYESLYDFLKKDDWEFAKQLNSYQFLYDEIIYVFIVRYWEKKLFLYISSKYNYNMQNTINEMKKLQTNIDRYFSNIKLEDKQNNLEQKIINIALWVWINVFCIFTNKFEPKKYNELIKSLEKLIDLFLTYSKQNIKNFRNDIEQTMLYTTMQESAYIIISSILTIKKIDSVIKHPSLEKYIQEIIDLYRLKINVNDNERAFDDVIKLMQLQSLMWRQSNYINRYYNLIIIRIQLYSCWHFEYTIEDELKYKFKDELGIISTKHDFNLSTIANFTLCNLYSKYSSEISSNYFQYACNFTENAKSTKITSSQLEYIFICLVVYWNGGERLIKKIIDCFIHNSKYYLSDILGYMSQKVDTNFLHLINTLRKFKDEKLIQFFTDILEQLKQNNTPNIEYAEAVWKNFEFEQMNKEDQFKNKKEYENFWIGKEKITYYSSALINILDLEDPLNLEHCDDLRNKIHTFLIQDDLNYKYSGHLLLACRYLNSFQNNKNDEYNEILEIVKEQEKITVFKNDLYIMQEIYDTLENCTEEPEYEEASYEIKLKLTNNRFNDQINFFNFLHTLCDVWLKNNYCEKRPQYNEIIGQDFSAKKKFLDECKQIPEVIIRTQTKSYINAEFLLISEIINSLQYQDGNIITEYQSLINKCNEKAEQNLNTVINMIMEAHPNYTEQIRRLYEQWEEQIIYDGKEEEE